MVRFWSRRTPVRPIEAIESIELLAIDRFGRPRPFSAVAADLVARRQRAIAILGQIDLGQAVDSLTDASGRSMIESLQSTCMVVGTRTPVAEHDVESVMVALHQALTSAGAVVAAPETAPGSERFAIDLLSVGLSLGSLPDGLVSGHLVEVLAPPPVQSPGWTPHYRVGRVERVGLANASFLPVPAACPVAADLLRSPPIARQIVAWLIGGPVAAETGHEPWRERELLILAGSLSPDEALDAIRQRPRPWCVVLGGGPPPDRGAVVVPAPELRVRLDEVRGRPGMALADVVDGPAAPTIDISAAPPFRELVDRPTDGVGSPRLLAVDDYGLPTAVVPSIADLAVPTSTAVDGPTDRRIWLDHGDKTPDLSSEPADGGGRRLSPAADRSTRPETVSRVVQATGPATLGVGQEREVEVVVADPATFRPARSAGSIDFAAAALDPTMVLDVHIRPSGGVSIEGPAHRRIAEPGAAETTSVRFAIRGTQSGPARVIVTLRQGADDLAGLSLPVLIGPPADSAEQRASAVAAVGPGVGARLQLRCYRDGPDGLICEFADPDTGAILLERFTPPVGWRTRVRHLLGRLGKMHALRFDHAEPLDAEMLGLGLRLRNDVLPPTIIEALWESRHRHDPIELVSDEPFVPWEACAVANPRQRQGVTGATLLGHYDLIRRWPGPSPGRDLAAQRDRRLLVAPTYEATGLSLRAQQAEAELLQGRFGASPIGATLGPFFEAVNGGDYDVLHFAGHGIAEVGDVDASMLVLDDSRFDGGRPVGGFTPEMLDPAALQRRPGPVVFLNGCSTGQISPNLDGFAAAFLRSGAAVFVGSQWAIDDGPALEFAEAFYGALLEDGLTLREAAGVARAIRGPVWSANYLSYAIYGDPFARVGRPSQI